LKTESEIGKTSYGEMQGEFRLMYLLLGNDTVPISTCRDRGMRSTE